MSRMRLREVGSACARCARCGAEATLTVTELSVLHRWSPLRERGHAPLVTRSATCSVCVTTYWIRSTDGTAQPAARRRDRALEDVVDRDWAYPPREPVAARR